MNAINTSGVSGWSFPIRIEQYSEYVVIDTKNNNDYFCIAFG